MFAPGWCGNRCYGPCRPKSTQSAVSPGPPERQLTLHIRSLRCIRFGQHRTCCPGHVLFWSKIWLVLQNRTPPELCWSRLRDCSFSPFVRVPLETSPKRSLQKRSRNLSLRFRRRPLEIDRMQFLLELLTFESEWRFCA